MDVFSGALQAAEALESLVLPCFGPNGLGVLQESGDGHAWCTDSGIQLLRSLQLSHPAGILLSNAVQEYHKLSGDGSKKMLIMVAAALREMHRNFQETGSLPSFELSWLLYQLRHTLTDSSLGVGQRSSDSDVALCYGVSFMSDDVKRFCPAIIDTCCTLRYGYCVRKKVKEIATSWLLPSGGSQDLFTLSQNVKYLLKEMDRLVTLVPGVAVSESCVLSGFVLERDFHNSHNLPNLPHLPSRFKFAVLLSGLCWEEATSTPASISVQSVAQMQQAVHHASEDSQKFTELIHHAGIKLVLCGGQIGSCASSLLHHYGILAVQMVPEDTLRMIAEFCGSHPFADTNELMSAAHRDRETVGLRGLTCRYVQAGQRRYIHLDCLPAGDTTVCPQSLLLCAPTTGFCRQLLLTLTNLLRVFRACIVEEEEGPRLVVVPGGGGVEVAMVRLLEQHVAKERIVRGSPSWVAAKSLQKAFLAIPYALLSNSAPRYRAGQLAASLHQKVFGGGGTVSVDCAQGMLRVVDWSGDWSVWEPYSTQNLLIAAVVNLLSQLVRLDFVGSVSGRVRPLSHREQEEEERDYAVVSADNHFC